MNPDVSSSALRWDGNAPKVGFAQSAPFAGCSMFPPQIYDRHSERLHLGAKNPDEPSLRPCRSGFLTGIFFVFGFQPIEDLQRGFSSRLSLSMPESNNMLILASSSPRRRELLTLAGIAFTVDSIDIDETHRPGESPEAFTQRLAREKAEPIFAKHPNATVLGADTIVVCDEKILGKPIDAADAARMLRLLSGRNHQVITGVAVLSQSGTRTQAEITMVTMKKLSEEEIKNYIATGEPMGKAGAYAIQGRASIWIPRIEGDYFNVVGLPLALVASMLANK
jgi:septum formation protein